MGTEITDNETSTGIVATKGWHRVSPGQALLVLVEVKAFVRLVLLLAFMLLGLVVGRLHLGLLGDALLEIEVKVSDHHGGFSWAGAYQP
jgi:hypothetical protein